MEHFLTDIKNDPKQKKAAKAKEKESSAFSEDVGGGEFGKRGKSCSALS